MPDEPKDLWTQILELLSQLITPDWNALILLLPFAMLALALLLLWPVAMAWRRAGTRNRPRVMPRRARSAPAGVHLPGPSMWPFVAPIGGALVLLALVFPAGGLPINPILFAAGLAVSAIAVGGWLWDAGREWRRTEWGHGQGPGLGSGEHTLAGGRASVMLAPGPDTLVLPEGVHLPGPSPWPFFVPIAGGVVLLGLIFGPILILGGILMGLLAIVGWYRDAGHEYRQVEAGHLPEPSTRDPERAFPKSLLRVYGAIAVASVVLTIAPSMIGALPGNAGGGGGGPTAPAESPDAEPEIAAESVTSFTSDRLVVPADTAITLTFDNRQAGVPHDVTILQGETAVFEGEDITGPDVIDYDVPPLAAGEYRFICSIHPPMTGTLVAQ